MIEIDQAEEGQTVKGAFRLENDDFRDCPEKELFRQMMQE